MATGLLALLDDITSILDDVSAALKVAAGKTGGACSARQRSGVLNGHSK